MGGRAKLDLVPELRRQLVGVGRAPHPRQHRRVVDGGALGVVDVHSVGQREGDPALAQDVLLRHAEPEIGRQRQGRDQLRQAQAHLCSGYPEQVTRHTTRSTLQRWSWDSPAAALS